MALTPGTRLGVDEITAPIGEGGMGQVYAADHDRLARFQREAEVLASLNHPNFAGIYRLEEGGGTTALVMEFVEGKDLSQKLEGLRATGTGLPLDEDLPIAKQILGQSRVDFRGRTSEGRTP